MANIHTAILAVMQEVGYVKKQRSAGLNYSYAGEAALIGALRPEMVEQGIYVYVHELRNVQRSSYTTAKGAEMQVTTLEAVVRFVHAASETYIDVLSAGEGADSGDKSQNKAMTAAYKYALRQTFCIETGDDPDKDASVPRAEYRQQEQRPQAAVPRVSPAEQATQPASKDSLLATLGGLREQERKLGGVNREIGTAKDVRGWTDVQLLKEIATTRQRVADLEQMSKPTEAQEVAQ